MDPIIVRDLRKSYGGVQAVQDVSFSVERGSIFGLIGPDGGGKTTLMRIIVSLLSFGSGEVLFQGRRVDREPGFVRAHVGYMPQRFSLYQDLTVEENLRFFGDLFQVAPAELKARRERLYEFSGLAPCGARRAGALSGGMKQKLALSCMLLHAPEVVVLDEPTFGVDPVSRADFWQILRSLRDQGITILASTGYMDEALQCDRVALVYKGRILAADVPARLPEHFTDPLFLVDTDAPLAAYETIRSSTLCRECNLFGEGVHFTLAPGTAVEEVAELLKDRKASFRSIRPVPPGLEDLFLLLMKEEPQ
ncbi:MAG: ABC transporter ATP-binding protein [Spirochaetia bacterium]